MKLLIGGSPCTHWSIAQTKNRETTAEGIGWELFKNYIIAREKFNPDYFLYENNKSMSPEIRKQITAELGVEPILINSALVSAQNRQRLYWTNIPNVQQPGDRGILLRDVLETATAWQEKSYCLTATEGKGSTIEHNFKKHIRTMVAEPVNMTAGGKAQCIRATCYKDGIRNMVGNSVDKRTCVAELVRIGTIESDAKNLDFDSQQYRVYSPDGTEILIANGKIRQGDSAGSKQGKYVYTELADKSNTISAGQAHNEKVLVPKPDGVKFKTIYEVRDGLITIKDKQYPIKLADGYYIIRKLTVTECKRLQTVPDDYIFPTSDTQAYKMLGNGWTVDVIAHILSYCPGIKTDPIDVLSMYDGMSCGHIALDKLGANVHQYYATEIDKYAIQTTMANYPETIQLGDAFYVREDNFELWGDKH